MGNRDQTDYNLIILGFRCVVKFRVQESKERKEKWGVSQAYLSSSSSIFLFLFKNNSKEPLFLTKRSTIHLKKPLSVTFLQSQELDPLLSSKNGTSPEGLGLIAHSGIAGNEVILELWCILEEDRCPPLDWSMSKETLISPSDCWGTIFEVA
ncbi:hypothetical protein PanWU01x14_164440 [Parasponia andersonii]|uniref:Uncharacterized protein n=1 Tax=Parasponia andersonii TaxID=3476 RepID=A0A2P5CCF2_PARAD|nr:hypothetical protein PanWU01x14_164440 [Parasponia andersonii]